MLVSVLLLLPAISVVADVDQIEYFTKSPENLLSYMQAHGFMQIDQIIDNKACVSYNYYITHDSTQKCLRHGCTNDSAWSEFDCKLWGSIKKNSGKPKKWPSQLTRRVRNHTAKSSTLKISIVKSSTAKNSTTKVEGEYKETLLEKYFVKPDNCTNYSKIRTTTGTTECWRKNCKDEFSARVTCKLFDGVKVANREILYKKRRHHGKA